MNYLYYLFSGTEFGAFSTYDRASFPIYSLDRTRRSRVIFANDQIYEGQPLGDYLFVQRPFLGNYDIFDCPFCNGGGYPYYNAFAR